MYVRMYVYTYVCIHDAEVTLARLRAGMTQLEYQLRAGMTQLEYRLSNTNIYI